MSLLSELKRRNVVRVAAAYLALGWIVTQVTATVAPILHLPEWTGPVVLWIGVIGFPFVVMFSWIYELTPEGLKKEREVERSESITHLTARRLDYVVIGLLVVAIGLFALREFRPQEKERLTVVASTRDATAPAPAAPSEDRSVAVLPFVDMSAARDQEYFADGISEEVLNLLAKVPELRVIARTSSFSFKDKNVDITEIANKLNVANVLEGSVRKSGDTLRITAQLIRASDSSHLWSQTYDRKVTDVFAVQDEIAAAVVEQLKVTLLRAAPKSRVTDPQAYEKFLQARQLGLQFTPEGFAASTALLEEVVARDPTYVEAWRLLARDRMNMVGFGLRPIDEAYAEARQYIDKALAIDPDYGRGHDGLAIIALSYDHDLQTAAREWRLARQLDPGNTDIISNASQLLDVLGRRDQSIAVLRYVLSRDPLSANGYTSLGWSYYLAGRLAESAEAYRTALKLGPGYMGASSLVALTTLLAGDAQGALAEADKEPSELSRLWAQALAYQALGKRTESDAALEQLIRKYEKSAPAAIASVYAYRRESDLAFEWLEKAVTYHDPGFVLVSVDPVYANLHDDPRWLPILRRHGMAPEQVAAIEFEVKIPE